MSFDVNAALSEGWDRTTSRTGLELIGLFVVAAVTMALVTNSLLRTVIVESGFLAEVIANAPPEAAEQFRSQFENAVGADVLGLPLTVLVVLVVAVWLAQTLLKIGAVRWFVEAGGGGLSAGLFTRRVLWTVGNLIVGGILYAITVGIGLILLVAPGIFLAVALFFYNYEIIVEGENAIEALASSWELTKGHRLPLFLLGLLFFVVGWILGAVTGPFTIADPLVRSVVSSALNAALGVFGIGVAAAAYRQLRRGPEETTEDVGALGPEDL